MPFLDEQGLQRLWENIVAEVDSKTQGYPPIYKEGPMVSAESVEGLAIDAVSKIEPIQAGSGDPSPTNVRPISGWTGASLTRTGKNLLKITAPSSSQAGVTFTVDNGSVIVHGTTTDRVYFYLRDQIILPPGTYTMSGTPSGIDSVSEGVFYDDNHNLRPEGTATVSNDFTVRPYLRLEAGVTFNNAIFRPQIESGNKATPFEPYQGTQFTAPFGQTVYGGELDWKTGVLKVTHCKIIFDGVSDGARVYHSDGPGTQYGYLHPYEMSVPFKQQGNISSNKLVFSDDPIYSAQGVGITTVLWLKIPVELTGIQENDSRSVIIAKTNNVLNQWYEAGEPLEVVYELAAPTSVQLTPQQILSLAGENNLWSDCGNTEAIFNTTIAPVEKEMTLEVTGSGNAITSASYDSENKKLALTKGTTYTTKNEFDNLKIGGTNILPGYADERSVSRNIRIPVRSILEPHVGKEICISFECKATIARAISMYAYQSSGISIRNTFSFTPSTTEFTRHSFKTTVYDWGQKEGLSTGEIIFHDYAGEQNYTIRKVKIELGNKPTDWSPCPEDVDAAIAEASETVKTTALTPSSKTKYYPTLSDNATTETDSLIKNSSISVNLQNGTTSTAGVAQLILGNGTATGTAGNMTGYITLYAANGSDHRIYPNDNGSSGVHTLPPSSGTLVNGSNYVAVIPAATTSKAGLLSAADKQKLDELVSGGDSGESTITYVTAGKGLTGGGASGNVTLNVGAGSGIKVAADSISVNTDYTTSGKNYKVQVDGTSGGLFVNVPWANDNTTYSAGTGISLSGTTFSNSGVRSISSGSTNGTISVNTGGTAAEVAVKGLGSAAYTSSDSYLKLSGGTMTGAIKGVDYINIDPIIGQPTGTAIGWYRCATFTASNSSSPNVIFMLRRAYYSPQNEGYVFSITLGYNGEVSITQLSGVIGGHIVPKIRVDYINSGEAYIDYYMATSDYNNAYWVSGFGDATFQTPTLVTSATGTTYEFETVQGCKSDKGFVGNLTGNASTATNVAWTGITGKPAYYDAKAIRSISRSGTTFTYTCLDGSSGTFTQQDNFINYSGGAGISVSGSTITNTGVRSVSTGSANGTISVNTNGTAANVAVKGLGSAAYAATSAFAPADHTHSYLSTTGGALSGRVYYVDNTTVETGLASLRNIKVVTTAITSGSTAIPTGEIWLKYE